MVLLLQLKLTRPVNIVNRHSLNDHKFVEYIQETPAELHLLTHYIMY